MYKTITENDFVKEFENMDRKDNFSYNGLKALYKHLEDYEEYTGEKVKLDIIALCCDYSEYKNFKEFKTQDYTDIEDMDELRNKTTVIDIKNGGKNNGFIIHNF